MASKAPPPLPLPLYVHTNKKNIQIQLRKKREKRQTIMQQLKYTTPFDLKYKQKN